MARRLVVIGADAAGMSAASQALRVAARLGRRLTVVVVEASGHTSYSACGIPYWMAGDVAAADDLVARTAAQHRANGIDLRLHTEAVDLDLDRGVVEVRRSDAADGGAGTDRIGFDEVLVATGAAPIQPEWSLGVPGVLPVKTLDDGARWLSLLDDTARGGDTGRGDRQRRALVVGGGYIGVEMAETFVRLGYETTMVTRGAEPLSSTLDPSMGVLVRQALERAGVTVVTGVEVDGLDVGADGQVGAASLGGQEHHVDLVAMAIGVRARTGLTRAAGLPVGAYGGLVPDDTQRITDGVWAAGDCCEVYDRVAAEHHFVPLGTHANKAGRVAGTNLGGGRASFPGVVGTAITRTGDVEVARAGVLTSWAVRHGWDVETVQLDSTTASGYMPEAEPITVRVLAERGTGRLVGTQIVGGRGAGKRIDIAAMAMWAGFGVADVAQADLAYAPPLSPVWDPVQITCRKAADQLGWGQ